MEHTLDSIREINEKENENVRAARLTMQKFKSSIANIS